jgi:hypothetical protein
MTSGGGKVILKRLSGKVRYFVAVLAMAGSGCGQMSGYNISSFGFSVSNSRGFSYLFLLDTRLYYNINNLAGYNSQKRAVIAQSV